MCERRGALSSSRTSEDNVHNQDKSEHTRERISLCNSGGVAEPRTVIIIIYRGIPVSLCGFPHCKIIIIKVDPGTNGCAHCNIVVVATVVHMW